jgi:hypothetical protein
MSNIREIKFVKRDDYKILISNGAWGSITPRGDFLIHFYYEYTDLPDIEKLEIGPKGV